MRFAIFYLLIICAFVLSARALSPVSALAQDTSNIILRRAGSNDLPIAPETYTLSKLAQNLGDISAIVQIDSDIFITERDTGRLLRLRYQNQDGRPDIQTVFLIGFDAPSGLVASEDRLYISDNTGIWIITPAQGLQAHQAPTKLHTLSQGRHPLAVDTQNKILYVGDHGKILAINLTTRTINIKAQGAWKVNALTISPNGQLWAGLQTPQGTHLTEIPTQSITDSILLENITVEDIVLWNTNILVAQSGATPMITQHTFSYGNLTSKSQNFIAGFSAPSYFKGKTSKWGQPTAMIIDQGGHIVFADAQSGIVWHVSELPEVEIDIQPDDKDLEKESTDPDTSTKKTAPILILRGSGINKNKLLSPKKPKEELKSRTESNKG